MREYIRKKRFTVTRFLITIEICFLSLFLEYAVLSLTHLNYVYPYLKVF